MQPELGPEIEAFLAGAGWAGCRAVPLAGDASSRRYLRLRRGHDRAILMDATADGKTLAFARIAEHLTGLGLSAPVILAADHARALLLLEDLGDSVFVRVIEGRPDWQNRLYSGAIHVLATIGRHPPPPDLVAMDAAEMARIASMVIEVYQPAANGLPVAGLDAFMATLARVAEPLVMGPQVLMLRDYHAENLLWLPRRRGVGRVGLLDFQDAMLAHPAYDLVSLLQDARRDVPQDLEASMVRLYCRVTGQAAGFDAAYAMMGAQRALRIIGIFARLALVAGKPHYLRLIPRVWRQLQRNLAHPALADLAQLCNKLIPEPTEAVLNRIQSQCPKR